MEACPDGLTLVLLLQRTGQGQISPCPESPLTLLRNGKQPAERETVQEPKSEVPFRWKYCILC